eukprot:TRINITY_DN57726_c0_g1_i1.p1 TRINITY_DN57726_c0_g1~~TRINITY_DN57726_c0_g1_i1.p1  ORF type:complete len:253 (-),score=35.11 TRINITY_DN57726_c0_g1_i1:57-815(-)
MAEEFGEAKKSYPATDFTERDADNFPVSNPEKPFIPDYETNDAWQGRLAKLKEGEGREDPERAAVKEYKGKMESTMMTKFENAELKALPDAAFNRGVEKDENAYQVVKHGEYNPSERPREESTFTDIDFGKDGVPETLEEAEEAYLGKWGDDDTPQMRDERHRRQIQEDKDAYARAMQEAEAETKAKPKDKKAALMVGLGTTKAPTSLLGTIGVQKAPTSSLGLPGNVVIKKKKKKKAADEGGPAKKRGKPE